MDPAVSTSTSSLLQKKSLNPSLHGSVDLALKRLKLVARRMSSSLTTFKEESRLLDRLFYKGKNQQRTSKFWRHVEEMRRIDDRLIRLDISGSINRIRHAFYKSTDFENRNVLKSSWTHVPEVGDLKVVIHRFRRTNEYLTHMSGRYISAYCSFKRAMQTGAFLQLILTLSAISSRLHALTLLLLEDQQELFSSLVDLCGSLESAPLNPELKDEDPHRRDSNITPGSPTTPLLDDPKYSKGSQLGPERELTNERDLKGKFTSENIQERETRRSVQDPTDKKLKHRTKRKKPTDEIDEIFGF